MATLLDELVVKIGLDSAAFNTQASSTGANLAKVGQTARREASSLEDYLKKTHVETARRIQQIEQVGQQASQQFRSLSNNVIGFLGAIAGAYSLTQFAKNIVTADASVARMSRVLGISTEELSTWQTAAELAGGTAEDVSQSFLSLSQEYERQKATGQSALVPVFGAMNKELLDAKGNLLPFETLMKSMADFASKHTGPETTFFLGQLGLTPGMINLLMKGEEGVNKLLARAKELGPVTKANADAAESLNQSLVAIGKAVTRFGAAILTDLSPSIVQMLDRWSDWISKNKTLSTDVSNFLLAAIENIRTFATGVDNVVTALGGWTRAAEILFGIWAVSKLAPIATFFLGLVGMMGTATAATVGLGGVMVRLLPLLAPVLVTMAAIAAAYVGVEKALAGWRLDELPVGSPFWDRVSRDEQLKYPNSPASIEMHGYPGDGSGSWIWDKIRGAFGGGGRGGATDPRLSSIRDRFASDPRLGISANAASGLVSNLNAESGIRGINEMNNGPGFGWAQWTNTSGSPRRSNFEAFARSKGLDPSSDEANYEFLIEELRTRYPGILAQLRRGDISASEAASIVARGYIAPPADKIPGHVADAERVSKLPTPPMPPVGPTFGPQLPPRSAIDPGYSVAMRAPAAAGADYSRTSSVETHVNGPIVVNTAATDADGIAKGIGGALQKYAYVPQVNAGLA